MKENVRKHLTLLLQRYPELSSVAEDIAAAFEIICSSYESGGKLIIGGNGGSCSDAEHIVGELMKGFKLRRRLSENLIQSMVTVDPVAGSELGAYLQGGLPAIALSSHPSLNTAFMNDANGDMIYAQQLNVIANPTDVFLAISTSVNAKNLYYAAVAAKAKGVRLVLLSGKTGGKLKNLADVSLIMPCDETYQIQELHLPVYHCLCLMLEEYFFG